MSTRSPSDDVDRVKRLMEWARAGGWRVGPHLKVGDVELQIVDIRQALVDGPSSPMPTYETPEKDFGLDEKDLEPTPGLDG